MTSCDLLQIASLLLVQWDVHASYSTLPRPTRATLLFHADSSSFSSSNCGRPAKEGSRWKGTVDVDGGEVLARSCTAAVSVTESWRRGARGKLTVVVYDVCVELRVVTSSRLQGVLLRKVAIRHQIWRHWRSGNVMFIAEDMICYQYCPEHSSLLSLYVV